MGYRTLPGRYAPAGGRYAVAPKVVDRFYNSPEWRRLASSAKAGAGHRCQTCGAEASGRGLIADHVVEIRDGGARLDPMNVRVLCATCHQIKTAKVRAER